MARLVQYTRKRLSNSHLVYPPSRLRVRIQEKRKKLSIVDFGEHGRETLAYSEVFVVTWPGDLYDFSFLLQVEDGNAAIRDGVDDSQRSQSNRHSSQNLVALEVHGLAAKLGRLEFLATLVERFVSAADFHLDAATRDEVHGYNACGLNDDDDNDYSIVHGNFSKSL